jgi:hypothetical protein
MVEALRPDLETAARNLIVAVWTRLRQRQELTRRDGHHQMKEAYMVLRAEIEDYRCGLESAEDTGVALFHLVRGLRCEHLFPETLALARAMNNGDRNA